MEDSVGVDVEGDFDLRHAALCGLDAGELEVTEELVIGEERTLSLTDADIDCRLVISSGRESLTLLDGDGGIPIDHRSGTASLGLDGEGERGDIEEEDIFDISQKNSALNGCANGDHFIGVHTLVRRLACKFVSGLNDFRHAGHSANEDKLVNFSGGNVRFLEAIGDGLLGALEEVVGELFELTTGEAELDVLGTGGIRGDEGEVEVVILGGRESDLRLFCFFLNALEGVGLTGEVDAFGALELRDDVVDERVVPVVTTELGVAISCEDFKDAIGDFQDGDIESSTTEVINGDLLIGLGVESVGERCCGGLVDDAADLEAGDLASGLGGISL